MTKQEKQEIKQAQTLGYYSGFGGIEVKRIDYGIDDYIVYVAGAWCGGGDVHRVKIHYETETPYFLHAGARVRFDEVIRA